MRESALIRACTAAVKALKSLSQADIAEVRRNSHQSNDEGGERGLADPRGLGEWIEVGCTGESHEETTPRCEAGDGSNVSNVSLQTREGYHSLTLSAVVVPDCTWVDVVVLGKGSQHGQEGRRLLESVTKEAAG